LGVPLFPLCLVDFLKLTVALFPNPRFNGDSRVDPSPIFFLKLYGSFLERKGPFSTTLQIIPKDRLSERVSNHIFPNPQRWCRSSPPYAGEALPTKLFPLFSTSSLSQSSELAFCSLGFAIHNVILEEFAALFLFGMSPSFP